MTTGIRIFLVLSLLLIAGASAPFDPARGSDSAPGGPHAELIAVHGGTAHGTSANSPARVPETGNITVTVNSSATHAAAPLLVNLSASASVGGTPSSFTFVWDFGDQTANVTEVEPAQGGTATAKTNHTFTTEGKYTVVVTVTDNLGDEGTPTTPLTVGVAAAFIVTPILTPAYAVVVGRPVIITYNATGGVPPYRADWTELPAGCIAGASNMTCTAPAPGNYTLRLTVLDSTVDKFSKQVSFLVNPHLAVTAAYQSAFTCEGSTGVALYNFTAVGEGGSPPVNYTWTFGNGVPNGYGAKLALTLPLGETFGVSVRAKDSAGNNASATLAFSTSFPACGGTPGPSYAPPRELVVGAVVAAALVVIVLAWLVLRTGSPPRRPPPPLKESASSTGAAPASPAEPSAPGGASAPPTSPDPPR